MAEQQTNETAKREPFKINIEDHFDFGAIASSKFLTSTRFSEMVSAIFKEVFIDFEGCIFEVYNGEPTISLIFNHGDYSNRAEGDGRVLACERLSSKAVGSTVIDRGRSRDCLSREGDRYYLTEDGKDVIKTLLTRRLYNNGNPDFKKIVSEISDRGQMNTYFTQQTIQYTKVSYLSLDRLCALVFGFKDKSSNEDVEYSCNIASAFNPVNFGGQVAAASYILNITCVSSKAIADFYNEIGLGQSGLSIVR